MQLGKVERAEQEENVKYDLEYVGAESLINSRPLTYQSSHPADDVPLTPNHFLYVQIDD